jgi:hypothetical protein
MARLHGKGKQVICYFSAVNREDWRPDAAAFPRAAIGNPLGGWRGERWLDVRPLDGVLPIMKARIALAAARGCDAVDPDNVDGYRNDTGFPLVYDDQIRFNRALADGAHEAGLAVSLKNDLGQIPDLLSHVDFAVSEECFQYGECEALLPFVAAGKAVFGIEYRLPVARFCRKGRTMNFDFLRKRLKLNAWRKACR